MQASVQLVDDRGRKYLTVEERARFIRAAAHVRKPVDETFVLTIAHTGARVSDVLALRALDVDLDAGAVRIRTLKRRVEHWREVPVPVPPELARDLEMVHCLREASARRVKEPLWPLSRATAHRKVVAVMRMASIEGPQACPKVRIASDDFIAGLLNRNRLKIGRGNRWTRQRVTSLRSHYRIPVHRPAIDGVEPWLNLTRSAKLLQVTPKTLRRAAERGEIEAFHPLADGPWIFSRSLLESDTGHALAERARSAAKLPAGPPPDQPTLFTSMR